MHKVKISFWRPEDLVIELTDKQYEAAMDEFDWSDFYGMMEYEISEHLLGNTEIDDIRDVDG